MMNNTLILCPCCGTDVSVVAALIRNGEVNAQVICGVCYTVSMKSPDGELVPVSEEVLKFLYKNEAFAYQHALIRSGQSKRIKEAIQTGRPYNQN
jgi:UDP-N-acetylenolpyruvoylglucosamine reductase